VFLEEASRSRQACKQKRDLRLGTWNVRSLYRAGSLKAAARELARYKLDLEGVQEVRWDKGGTVRAVDCNFFYGKVVLYGCETWLLTLREERGLRVFENRVLRRIFGPKRDEVTGMEKIT
jgi:hypothetical protein